jgi:hypothetical protein
MLVAVLFVVTVSLTYMVRREWLRLRAATVN